MKLCALGSLRRRSLLLLCVSVLFDQASLPAHAQPAAQAAAADSGSRLAVRFAGPARAFGESMPTGNGRLGASMYGGVGAERISLNESSMWSGSPHDADRPDAYKQLPEIRRLLLAGKNAEAEVLVNKSFTSADKGGSDPRYGNYQELGSVRLHFDGLRDDQVSDYSRMLDLDGALATTAFTVNGIHYTRELFTSAPDQAVVLRLRADRSHALSFAVNLQRAARFETRRVGTDGLLMVGELDSGTPGVAGVRYATRLRVLPQGGTVTADGEQGLHVANADEVVVLITAATDYNGFAGRHSADADATAAQDNEQAQRHSYTELLARHQQDYRKYFRRVALQLGPDGAPDLRPAVERLADVNAGKADPGFAALYFQFGRYLLISSSRPGGLPANLQGLWAEGVTTPWNGDWHLNVNVQMNYWPAEPTGLSDLTEPLFRLISSLVVPGSHTARSYYAADGWVAHVMTNAWGFTSPGEQASWGSTLVGSAWLCQHIWAHYQYTGDKAYLRQMYPVLKQASLFYLSMLVREPKHGWLVTAPSNSPENSFYLPDGTRASVCMGPAIDEEILRFLFTVTAQAEGDLHTDAELRGRLQGTAQQLAPIQIGSDGRIMEWLEPYREVDPHHRHVSHLWALFPGDQIDAVTTPELAAAARKSLEVRGDGATGWSLAYKSLLWTRLGDGDHAYTLLENLWHPVDAVKQNSAGSLPNLWDVHPPFQIDGNFGATTTMAEMLMSSRPEEIRLLPALPSAWPDGAVQGLEAMGGVTVALQWRAGKLLQGSLRARRAETLQLRYHDQVTPVRLSAGCDVRFALDANGKLTTR